MGRVFRLRADNDPATIAADAIRPAHPDRMAQVAEWMAEHDGKLSECARELGMGLDATRASWKRVMRAMGGQAK